MRLIDADRLKQYFDIVGVNEYGCSFATIDSQPTVDAEPVRRGKWIEKEVIGGINSLTFKVEKYKIYKCSLCRIEVMPSSIKYKYCPDCGAKMEECENE